MGPSERYPNSHEAHMPQEVVAYDPNQGEQVLIGVAQHAAQPGEMVEVAAQGEAVYGVEDPVVPHTIGVIISVARAVGVDVPTRFLFSAAQVFYQDRRVEEVRLSGFAAGEPDSDGSLPISPWQTDTPPRLSGDAESGLTLDPSDIGRTHHCAMIVGDKDGPAFLTAWDLRENALAVQAKQPTVLPTAAYVPVDAGLLYQQFRRTVASKGFSKPDLRPGEQRWPNADLSPDSRKLVAHAEIRPHPYEVEPRLTEAELLQWQQRMAQHVMAMDDRTADVLDWICAWWLREAKHPEAAVSVTADDFLHLRGLQAHKSGSGRRGGYDQDLRRALARQLSILSSTWIRVHEMEATEEVEGKKGPYRKRTTRRGLESMAVVVSSRAGQVNLSGHLEVDTWRVRPGDVFTAFLLGPGRQTALLSLRALQYDPYRQRLEKRLTRYLSWQWRIRHRTADYLEPFSVRTLLTQAISGNVDPKYPARTKERLEQALNTLEGDRVISGWQYGEGWDENIVGQRGWVKKWLSWKVVIEPPQAIMDHYANIKVFQAAKTKALPVSSFDPSMIKQARKARGLTQLQAAEQVGIDQGVLSRIERGTCRPTPHTLKKIRKWLDETM